MISRKDEARYAITRVHENLGASLEENLADIEELADFCNDLIVGIQEDISRRDQGVGAS